MFRKAVFLKSVGDVSQLTSHYDKEIAVVGKSNVGKSSFINFLTGNGKLAKVGKEPGKTRLINYFGIDDNAFVLVDLPGYGFARVSDAEKQKWGVLIEQYLQQSSGLKHVFVLLDARREPSEDDKQMLHYLYFYAIPFTVIGTKCDKLTKNELREAKNKLATGIGIGVDNIYLCSSVSKTGKAEIVKRIEEMI